jgi:hypothetical protein
VEVKGLKRLEKQNVTLSIPKNILRKAKHMAIDRQTSLSRLLAKTLADLVEKEDVYNKAKDRQVKAMQKGYNMGLKGKISWKRDDLHARRK